MDKRRIVILGATGSIGTQALDLIDRYPDSFEPTALVACSNSEKLFDLVRKYRPSVAGLVKEPESIPEDVRSCDWVFGANAAVLALEASKPQDALCAIVGIAGLDAVWKALDMCERVLLANKEALVTGGDLVMAKAARLDRHLLPVDSEHSAIFQCLQARQDNKVRRLLLTASGGALRSWPIERMYSASVSDVLSHPTWNMGAKITVDCASMVNKGLEVMEAHHLFQTPVDDIEVIVHPQSIVHSMIEFEDGAVLAQLGNPDMRGPIGYAMGFPHRLPYDARPLDLPSLSRLDFSVPDLHRYPCLKTAFDVMRAGGNAPIVFNGANEAAVDAFLKNRIPFGAISEIIDETLSRAAPYQIASIEDVHRADDEAKHLADSIIRRKTC